MEAQMEAGLTASIETMMRSDLGRGSTIVPRREAERLAGRVKLQR